MGIDSHGITLRGLITKLQLLGISMGDVIGKIDIDFCNRNQEIIVTRDEKGKFSICIKKLHSIGQMKT